MRLVKLYDTVYSIGLPLRQLEACIFNSLEDRDTLEQLIPTHLLCDYIKSCVK